MNKVIDFYSEKEKLESEAKRKALEESLSGPEWKMFLDYCQKWKDKQAELARANFTLINSKGEII